MIRSGLFVPTHLTDTLQWTNICARHSTSYGYHIDSVVSTWSDLVRMLFTGQIHVAVAGQRDHLPPDRTPRIEFAMDQGKQQVPGSRRRVVRHRT